MPTKEYFFLISSHRPVVALVLLCRTVGWSENPGGSRNVVGINCPPMIEIGLIDLTKSEGEGGSNCTPALWLRRPCQTQCGASFQFHARNSSFKKNSFSHFLVIQGFLFIMQDVA